METKIYYSRILCHSDPFCFVVRNLLFRRGLLTTLSQAKTLLADIPSKDPYCKFAKFMIVAVEYKSLESYDLLGVSYRKFLETDIVYDKIYQSYGVYFFKKEVGKKGLDKLLSILS